MAELINTVLVFLGLCLSTIASVYIQQWLQKRKEAREIDQQTIPNKKTKADFAESLQAVTDKMAADYLEATQRIEAQKLDYEKQLKDQATKYEARLDEQDQKIKAFLEDDERIEIVLTGWPRRVKSSKVEIIKAQSLK